jgi:hypothetical protein
MASSFFFHKTSLSIAGQRIVRVQDSQRETCTEKYLAVSRFHERTKRILEPLTNSTWYPLKYQGSRFEATSYRVKIQHCYRLRLVCPQPLELTDV